MFKIVNKEIHLTRGDIACIEVNAKNGDGTDYIFKVGDVVRLKVFKKKDCGCVEIQKDVEVTEESTSVDINLEGAETKIGEVINKPTTLWYEIELNPKTNPQTILGYDETGEKIFILYPEGNDAHE